MNYDRRYLQLISIGADLYNLINQAALRAASLDQELITMADLEWAKDKIYMGMKTLLLIHFIYLITL